MGCLATKTSHDHKRDSQKGRESRVFGYEYPDEIIASLLVL